MLLNGVAVSAFSIVAELVAFSATAEASVQYSTNGVWLKSNAQAGEALGVHATTSPKKNLGLSDAAAGFQQGVSNYLAGNFTNAAGFFQASALSSLAPGAWCNLGNSEWLAGRVGPAILAWERARWLDPYLEPARNNLDFARKTERLELPESAWTELCSAWLPSGWWPWLASLFLWSGVVAAIWPNSAGPAKSNWRQGLVAGGLAGFLLVLPGLAGIHERAKLGVMLSSPAPLRLAPAPHGQAVALLSAGETVRRERQEGAYYMVRTANDVAGWVAATQVVWIAGSP